VTSNMISNTHQTKNRRSMGDPVSGYLGAQIDTAQRGECSILTWKQGFSLASARAHAQLLRLGANRTVSEELPNDPQIRRSPVIRQAVQKHASILLLQNAVVEQAQKAAIV